MLLWTKPRRMNPAAYSISFLAAASEAKKLKTNQYLAIALATVIMYPTMVNAVAGCYFKANSKSEKP